MNEGERKQLASAMGIKIQDFDDGWKLYLAAAEEEYTEMFLGRRVFTRAQDLREYRLVLLIKHAFQGVLPSEQQVSALFQTTQTQSRSLIRAVLSKYQYELKAHLRTALKSVIAAAEMEDDTEPTSPRLITIDNASLVSALNRELAAEDGTSQPIVKQRDRLTRYEIPYPSYMILKRSLERDSL